jgi:hypothetical protein
MPSQQMLLSDEPFAVRQNLYDFLEMIRQKQQPLPSYWIDAIRIDQASRAERNHQVPQMGDIFSGAESVQIWLGKNERLAAVIAPLERPVEAMPFERLAILSHANDVLRFICSNGY